ncbi:caspase family protein [Rhizobium sp. PP-CC-3G-465]|uniref:caspase family protein n=1 Tax=Rhizobium sp. PP-CC-3G-465 TaxID=2135648 RepID=UPI00104AF8E3|nr:caspase domain-containing protein [Rhizobium sp. PP-CC-3G-465]
MTRKMTALLIGNADYPDDNDLANPVHDAQDMANKLISYGFETIVATDCTARNMDKRLKEFRETLNTHDVGLFFFAGHGIQIEGINYLLALDTDMESEVDARHTSLSLDKVVDVMANSTAATKIIILDACRKNPWERRWHRAPGARGLASVYAPKGTIIGFATSPGEVAFDGKGRNGTYTAALLQHIDTEDCSIEAMFKRVRNEVAAASGGKQTSWEHTSLSAEFYFNLSLSRMIDEYDGTALADELFLIDAAKKSHQIIKGLKSHDWYRQNPAVELLTPETTTKMSKTNLFVIGRNLYQAACGSSHSAIAFINDFASGTARYAKDKRKAILDGMLFEIFFDSKGALRPKIKDRYFNELFELQRHVALKESFEFIAEALTAARAEFYALPGKGHELAVTAATKTSAGKTIIDAVYVGGVNVLRPEDDAWESSSGEPHYLPMDRSEFLDFVSTELIVPAHLLKITFTPAIKDTDQALRFPMGWTVGKG